MVVSKECMKKKKGIDGTNKACHLRCTFAPSDICYSAQEYQIPTNLLCCHRAWTFYTKCTYFYCNEIKSEWYFLFTGWALESSFWDFLPLSPFSNQLDNKISTHHWQIITMQSSFSCEKHGLCVSESRCFLGFFFLTAAIWSKTKKKVSFFCFYSLQDAFVCVCVVPK